MVERKVNIPSAAYDYWLVISRHSKTLKSATILRGGEDNDDHLTPEGRILAREYAVKIKNDIENLFGKERYKHVLFVPYIGPLDRHKETEEEYRKILRYKASSKVVKGLREHIIGHQLSNTPYDKLEQVMRENDITQENIHYTEVGAKIILSHAEDLLKVKKRAAEAFYETDEDIHKIQLAYPDRIIVPLIITSGTIGRFFIDAMFDKGNPLPERDRDVVIQRALNTVPQWDAPEALILHYEGTTQQPLSRENIERRLELINNIERNALEIRNRVLKQISEKPNLIGVKQFWYVHNNTRFTALQNSNESIGFSNDIEISTFLPQENPYKLKLIITLNYWLNNRSARIEFVRNNVPELIPILDNLPMGLKKGGSFYDKKRGYYNMPFIEGKVGYFPLELLEIIYDFTEKAKEKIPKVKSIRR